MGVFPRILTLKQILTLKEILPLHSRQLLPSPLFPTLYPSNCHQHCPIPGGAWGNSGQSWRKPHYCLWSSPLQTILVSGGISLSKVIFQQLCCGVRWDNTTGNSQNPLQELSRDTSLPENGCPSTATVVALHKCPLGYLQDLLLRGQDHINLFSVISEKLWHNLC